MADTESTILNDNLFFLAGALSRKLSSEADEIFATIGLSSSHTLLLLLIHENPGIRPSSLAEKLHLKPSTITRLVDKLERRQLVEKEAQGRATSIVCTSEGNELSAEIKEKWDKLMQDKQEKLGERYVEVLSEMIVNAVDNLSED